MVNSKVFCMIFLGVFSFVSVKIGNCLEVKGRILQYLAAPLSLDF